MCVVNHTPLIFGLHWRNKKWLVAFHIVVSCKSHGCAICCLMYIWLLIRSIGSDSGQYRSLPPWRIGHHVHLNAVSYLSTYDPFYCESFHQVMTKSICVLQCGNIYFRQSDSWIWQSLYPTPLSLLSLYKLSFPIVGLKISSRPILALKYLNFHVAFLGIYRIPVLVCHRSSPSHHNCILCWGMNIQNNDITQAST
jgi:hypothetical protein